MPPAQIFRFRPRFQGVALLALAVGLGFLALGLAADMARVYLVTIGGAGVVLGLLYLASPVWRLQIAVDGAGLEVGTRGGARRFHLAWHEIQRVVASPATKTCYVDGGGPERSFMVPGDGAPAPYDITDKHALYDLICAHVPAERVETVELIEKMMPGAAKPAEAATPGSDA